MIVWSYCRESSKATSTQSQSISIREWAEREGHTITEDFVDHKSSRDSKSRPALEEMLKKLAEIDEAKRPVAIVATEMSRIGVGVAYYLLRDLLVEKAGIQILFSESTLEVSDEQSEEDEMNELTQQFVAGMGYLLIKKRIRRGHKQRYKRQLPGADNPLQPWEHPVGGRPVEIQWYRDGVQAKKFKDLRMLVEAKAPLSVIARSLKVKDYRTIRSLIIRLREMFDNHKIDISHYEKK